MFFGLPRPNAPPETSQGLRPGTPLHVFKKARLPQAGPPPRVASDPTRVRVVRPRRDPGAPPPPPPPRSLAVALLLAGVAWFGAAVAEFLLGTRLLALAGVGLGWFALRWSRERPRHAAWWVLAASALGAAARVAWLLAAR